MEQEEHMIMKLHYQHALGTRSKAFGKCMFANFEICIHLSHTQVVEFATMLVPCGTTWGYLGAVLVPLVMSLVSWGPVLTKSNMILTFLTSRESAYWWNSTLYIHIWLPSEPVESAFLQNYIICKHFGVDKRNNKKNHWFLIRRPYFSCGIKHSMVKT